MHPAVFLDRDGVLNRAIARDGRPHPPATLDELEVLPGVAEALDDFKRAGFRLLVVTNQPDVARGSTSRASVERLNAALCERLPAIDRVYTCWHDGADACACRKPRPGLLLDAAHDFAVDIGRSVMVGDRWRDIDAGMAAGCAATVFIDHGWREAQPQHASFRARSLREASAFILNRDRPPPPP